MKKLILCFAIVFITLTSKAQYNDYRLGFEVSPQVTWLMGDDENIDTEGAMMGYNFGLIIDRHFAPNYAITSGIFINTTGGKLNYKNGTPVEIGGTVHSDIHKLTYRLKYLNLPVGIKLMTNDMGRNRFYAQMGLNNQFLIKTNNGSGKNIKNEVRFFNIGYQLGGGVEHSLGGNLFLKTGILFGSSFNDITNNKVYDDRTVLRKIMISTSLMF